MGYCMTNRDAVFTIKKKNVPKAVEAIRNLATQTHKGGGGSYSSGKKISSNFAWVDTNELENIKNIHEAFDVWGWAVEQEKGEVTRIYFNRDKIGDEEHLFDAVAPFVEKGSYIEMSGEDGVIWRWCFDGKECHENSALLDWSKNEEVVDAILKQKEILPTLLGIHPSLDERIATVMGGKCLSKES